MKEFKTKKDIVILAGTVFKTIDGEKHEWQNNEFEGTVKLSDNSMQFLIVNENYMKENPADFEEYYKTDKGPELVNVHDGEKVLSIEEAHKIVKDLEDKYENIKVNVFTEDSKGVEISASIISEDSHIELVTNKVVRTIKDGKASDKTIVTTKRYIDSENPLIENESINYLLPKENVCKDKEPFERSVKIRILENIDKI